MLRNKSGSELSPPNWRGRLKIASTSPIFILATSSSGVPKQCPNRHPLEFYPQPAAAAILL